MYRGWLQRKRYTELRRATTAVQAAVRGSRARTRYTELRRATTAVQAAVRSSQACKAYKMHRHAAVCLQAGVRGCRARSAVRAGAAARVSNASWPPVSATDCSPLHSWVCEGSTPSAKVSSNTATVVNQEVSPGEEDLLAFVANYRKQHVARREHIRQSTVADRQATIVANAKVELKRARIKSEKGVWQARQDELKNAGKDEVAPVWLHSFAASVPADSYHFPLLCDLF